MSGYILVIYGSPGAGKTSLGTAIAAVEDNAVLLSNDRIELPFRCRSRDSRRIPLIYRELASKAGQCLENRQSVILDATFHLRRYQRIVLEGLRESPADWVFAHVTAPVEVCRRRVAERDGGEGLRCLAGFEAFVGSAEPWDLSEMPPGASFVTIDGVESRPRLVSVSGPIPRAVLDLLGRVCS